MGRQKANVWKYFDKSAVRGSDKAKGGVICKFCHHKYEVVNASKMLVHLERLCSKCPEEVRKELKKNTTGAVSIATTSSSKSSSSFALTSPSPKSFRSASSAASSLHSFMDHMEATEQEVITELLSRAIYVSGAPLSMVEHPLWKSFFERIRPAYQLPTRKSVSTTRLDAEFCRMQADARVVIADAKNLALQCDGWSNIRNNGILNFIVNTPAPIFVEFVDTKANRHTGEYLFGEMQKIMLKYGPPSKYLVVIGDNAANMKKACELLHEEYPHIQALGCLAHTFHLLVGDILGKETMKKFIQQVVNIIKAIRQSQVLSALLAEINEAKKCNLSLHLPVKTRWGSILNCLTSMAKLKSSLQTFAVHEQAATVLAREHKASLLDDDVFWIRVENTTAILAPIIEWITKLEGDEPMIHRALYAFQDIEAKLTEALPKSLLSKSEEKDVFKKLSDRIGFAIGPIHLAATLLDPASQGHRLTQSEQLDAVEFVYNVSNDMDNITDDILVEMAHYRAREGSWSKPFLWQCVNKLTPVMWWKGMCGKSDLSQVAVRILTAPITSAATERSFSTFSRIHTKRRNRLTTQRAGKITYIAHNWKLLSESSSSSQQKRRGQGGGGSQQQQEDLVPITASQEDSKESDAERCDSSDEELVSEDDIILSSSEDEVSGDSVDEFDLASEDEDL